MTYKFTKNYNVKLTFGDLKTFEIEDTSISTS